MMKKGIIQIIIFTLILSAVGPFVAQAHEVSKEKDDFKLQGEDFDSQENLDFKEFEDIQLPNELELVEEDVEAAVVPLVLAVVLRFIASKGIQAAGKEYGKRAVVKLLGKELIKHSKVWKDFKSYKGKTKTNGQTGKKKRFYEWDYTHQDIEVYDSNGKHLGSMDPFDGEMYKGPVKGRTIKL